jgi:FMN-dependent NADH-azoreductase
MIRLPSMNLVGQKVRVYRNLNNGLWSVKASDQLVVHVPTIHLANVTFHVSKSGRNRVRQKKQREVHAWAQGLVIPEPGQPTTYPVTYNPYHDRACFVGRTDNAAVYAAPWASFETRSTQPECYIAYNFPAL